MRHVKKPAAPWLKKDGSPDGRLAIAKYLTKDGKLRKNKKLPPGVRTVGELWDYLNSKNRKPVPGDEGLICVKYIAILWDFWSFIENQFERFAAVFMGGKKVKSYDDMLLYLDDYLAAVIAQNQKENNTKYPEIPYQICRNSLYEYLYF